MKISVVIPMLNEAGNAPRAIASAVDGGAHEVICVDGGSSDDSCEIARVAGARVIEGPQGRGVQQNVGAAAASGDVLLFLHADNWLAPEAIAQIDQACTAGCQVGGLRQKIEAEGCLYRWLEAGNALRVVWFGSLYGDQAIFMQRELFEKLGGFPPIAIMEDIHIMRRVRQGARPRLLTGPVHVNARRWQQKGVVGQTARNWLFLIADRLGVSPATLAKYYAPHKPSE